ncbi:MAG TPA: ABC transporter substrate-binding protein [Candidatus Binataceae bacterium]|nr:ABC transporter substrate-binding protein [Candidatus Binataceae bacterium]
MGLLRFSSLSALLLLVPLLGCGRGNDALQLPPNARILHLASLDDIPTLDPAAGYDTASWTFEQMIFDTLVRYSDAGVDLVPDLATSWQESADARTFTFHLRRNATFTNGRAVTSADLRYEIERVLTPATRSKGIEYYRDIIGAEAFVAGRASTVSGIETPDPWTIIFHLAAADPIFLDKLAMPFAAAVPREAAQKWGDDFSRHVIGSGPFMLRQWRSGQQIVLVRNPHYFDPSLPRLDAIVMQLGVDPELEWLKFQAGDLDISAIPPAEFPYVMKTPRLRNLTLHITTLSTDYLGMNCRMKPFDDVRVRQAFNYAIRKPKLIAILNGRGVAASGILPPGLPGYDPGIRGYPFDPAKARALLEAAGVGRNFAPTLWLRADQQEITLAESVQQDLAQVGVHLILKPVAWSALLEAIRQPHTVEFFSLGWEADFPDPQNFLEVLFARRQWGSNNDSFYANPRVDQLLDEAAPLSDRARRYALYDEAQQLILGDAPWVVLYYPVTYVIRQPWVHNYILNPLRPTRFDRVWLAPHPHETP